MAKLSEAFILQMGKTPARANEQYWNNGDNAWISISDLSTYDKYVGETKETISNEAVKDSGIKLIPENTVIMSFKLSLGKTAITTKPVYTNEAIMAFIPNGKYDIFPSYFYHMFSSRDWSKGTNRAVMGITLNKATLGEMDIDIPDLEKQQEIANKLDSVDMVILQTKLELSKLDELVKSRFIEMFGTYPENQYGWNTATIRDIVSDVRYGSSRPAVEGGAYPYLRMNNITYGGELDLADVKRIDVPESELPKCTVRRGDVLFNRTNSRELVGKTCVYDRDEAMVLAGFVIRVRVNDRVLPEFLSAFLNTDFSKQMLFGMCKAAIGQANINAQEMQNIGIYVPPIETQRQFILFKQQTDKSKFDCELFIKTLKKCYSEVSL